MFKISLTQVAKRDPEVAAPLILDKREKKNYYRLGKSGRPEALYRR